MSTSKELQSIDEQITRLQEQRKSILDEQRGTRLQEVKEIIQQFGFTAVDLGLVATTTRKTPIATKSKAEPMYANPTDPSQTWAGGKGARPKWVKAHLEAGGKLEDLLIKK